jgi:flagellar biogenesis protein FliO
MDVPILGVLALLAVCTAPLWVKRLRGAAPESTVSVLGRTALSRSAVVAVVRVGDRRLLVGAGEHGVNVLSELPELDAEGRTDAVSHPEATDLSALTSTSIEGPRIGLLDRLRVMTVRSTPVGRPLRVPSRR